MRERGRPLPKRTPPSAQMSLSLQDTRPPRVTLSPGAVVLRGYALPQAEALVATIHTLAALAPFRSMQTPGGGTMSAALTSCGALGWVTDHTGYIIPTPTPLPNSLGPLYQSYFCT